MPGLIKMNTNEESCLLGAEVLLLFTLQSCQLLHLLSLLAVERSDTGHLPNNKLLFWPWGMTATWLQHAQGWLWSQHDPLDSFKWSETNRRLKGRAKAIFLRQANKALLYLDINLLLNINQNNYDSTHLS